MLMIKIIFHIFSLFYVCFDIIFCTDYYVKTSGSNSYNGFSYSTAFLTIDHVMTNVVNGKGGNNRVYVDKGTYYYGISFAYGASSGFSNLIVNITGYVEETSHVVIGDTTTYPLINSTTATSRASPFYFYSNLICSFVYLHFFVPSSVSPFFFRCFIFLII
jgi:hypothetical protein